VPSASGGNSPFSQLAGVLNKPQPAEGVHALLSPRDPMRDLLIGAENDPDKCLWGLARVPDSILSKISELGEAQQFPKEVVFARLDGLCCPTDFIRFHIGRTR